MAKSINTSGGLLTWHRLQASWNVRIAGELPPIQECRVATTASNSRHVSPDNRRRALTTASLKTDAFLENSQGFAADVPLFGCAITGILCHEIRCEFVQGE